MKALIALVFAICTGGCTSMFKVMTDDPVRATNIRADEDDTDAIATISLDASRRNVIVALKGQRAGQFCAEPPPDTASAIESILDANIRGRGEVAEKKAEAEAGVKDTYKSNVVVVAKRTELLDIYRTGTYSLCQYSLNGGLKPSELKDLFELLTRAVVARVPEPIRAEPTAQNSVAPPSTQAPASTREASTISVLPVVPVAPPLPIRAGEGAATTTAKGAGKSK